MDPQATELPSLGGSLALTFLSLGLVCLLAYFTLKWVYRRGVGQSNGPIRVVARCSPEHKRSLFLIEAAGRCFLVGASDGGMNLLAEVDPEEVRKEMQARETAGSRWGRAARGHFTEILNRVLSRPDPARTDAAAPPPGPIEQPGEQKG
jgi:flagellar biogenesis protein FliO